MYQPKLLRGFFAKMGVPNETVSRYAKFCLVGGSGVVIDVLLLCLLLGPQPTVLRLNVCKAVAGECAILNNFTWNELWTFGNPVLRQQAAFGFVPRFFRFNLISASGLVITGALLNWQVYGLAMNIYLANLISIVLVSIWNFGLSSKFGWNVAG
jgi:dolichol-phosphate mannosyltransferase